MSFSAIMDEDGVVTLRPELIEKLGWEADIVLDLSVTAGGEIVLTEAETEKTASVR